MRYRTSGMAVLGYIPAIKRETVFLVEPPRAPVLFEYPQRHFRKTAAPKLVEHVIYQHTTVAATAQVWQHMQ